MKINPGISVLKEKTANHITDIKVIYNF